MDLDILEPVIEAFSKYTVVKQPAPSYVQFYTKSKEDVVLVYYKNQKAPPTSTAAPASKDVAVSEQLELTGSPLKLDLSLHNIMDDTLMLDEPQLWQKEEAFHLPISLDRARDVANLYNELLREQDKEAMVPMWIVCDARDDCKAFLLTAQSYRDCFARGIVTYAGCSSLDEVNVGSLVEKYARQDKLMDDQILIEVDCKFLLAGMSYGTVKSADELLGAPHAGVTELHCEWSSRTIQTPLITSKVTFEQEVIVGHTASPCDVMWTSLCALQSINQLLVDMTVAGYAAINLNDIPIRRRTAFSRLEHNTSMDGSKRLTELLNEVETYTYTAQSQKGGCICISDDTTSLKQCLVAMATEGSSNDFTYRLWDILRDCDTAEDLVTLLIQALKVVSTGKMKPFIDPNNKSYLAKIILKLSRGHSQTSKVLKNLRTNPPQALSLVGQVGIEKTMWEYTQLLTLVEHSFVVNGIWANDVRSSESIEQINQTIHDMTMGGGDFSLNPFENKSFAENSIRLDSETFFEEDSKELSVDNFASLKKHGLVTDDKKLVNEVPLIVDEIDISSWKNTLMKFTQVHVCLEHLHRAQKCLTTGLSALKSLAPRLREHYVSERSPIKTVGQLFNEPAQRFSMLVPNNLVKDNLKKPAFWYRVRLSRKDPNVEDNSQRKTSNTYVYSQLPVFPPAVWQAVDPNENVSIADADIIKYHCTKYIYLSNDIVSTFHV